LGCEARYSDRFKTSPIAKIQDKIHMHLDGFEVGLVFSILPVGARFNDGGGIYIGVQEIEFLVMDMVVPKA
jgi:hypothetical protein